MRVRRPKLRFQLLVRLPDKGSSMSIEEDKTHVSSKHYVKMNFALFFTRDGKAIRQYHDSLRPASFTGAEWRTREIGGKQMQIAASPRCGLRHGSSRLCRQGHAVRIQ